MKPSHLPAPPLPATAPQKPRHPLRPAFATAFLLLLCLASPLPAAITWTGDIDPSDPTTWTLSKRGYIGKSSTGSITVDGASVLNSDVGFLGYDSGSSGTATVTGTGSKWSNYGGLDIGISGTGTLTIKAGGQVSNTHGYLGYSSNSSGTAIVTGVGSQWINSSELYVGNSGTGTLNIEIGGQVSSSAGYIGYESGSSGTVRVTGNGSTWTLSNNLDVGYSGAGDLNINAGGKVSSVFGCIGWDSGSNGTVTVTGIGSTWTNSGSLYVGRDGTGTLTVKDGGTVIVGGSIFATNLYGNGTIIAKGGVVNADLVFDAAHGLQNSVTFGSGGTLTITQSADCMLGVGSNGNGTLRISEGVAVASTTGYLGSESGSSGTATVTGTGSKWANSDYLYIGDSGKGTLNIEAGGLVSNTYGIIGSSLGSSGKVTVSGIGSKWTNSGYLAIGYSGTGTLNIEAGGQVSSLSSQVISYSASQSTVTVTGTGSTWSNTGDLYVGGTDNGTLTVKDGGTVVVGGSIFASNLFGNGTISANGGVVDVDLVFDAAHGLQGKSIFGSGGTLTITPSASNPLGVGYGGAGSLRITEGVTIASASGYLGYNSGSFGTATVTGTGSKWINSGDLYIGKDGNGSLTVNDGGTVVVGGSIFASNLMGNGTISANGGVVDVDLVFDAAHVLQTTSTFGSSGAITITQASSNPLGVGYKGTGSLRITEGVNVTSTDSYLGYYPGSNGTATVTGIGSTWTTSDEIAVGYLGNGTLNIEGGQVSSSNALIGRSPGSTGTVNVMGSASKWTNSGELYVGKEGTGTLNIGAGGQVSSISGYIRSSGMVTVTGTGSKWSNSSSLSVGGTLNIEAGGVVSSYSRDIKSLIGPSGIVTITGTGSRWSISSSLYVYGILNIKAGGVVYSGYDDSNIGYTTGSSGIVTVTGTGSKWNNSSSLYIGNLGTGTLNIEAGGQVSSSSCYIGYSSGSSGTVTVTGAGSKWTSGNIYLDLDGSGTLTVNEGGTVVVNGAIFTSLNNLLGNGTISANGGVLDADLVFDATHGSQHSFTFGSGGTLTVNQTASNSLGVGYKGTGTMSISEGVNVSSSDGYIGYNSGSTGKVSITGIGSKWTNSRDLFIGYNGTGTLNIGSVTDSDVLIVTNSLKLAYSSSASAICNFNGGTIQTALLGQGSGTASFNWNNGTIRNYDANTYSYVSGSTSHVLKLAATGTHAFYIDAGHSEYVFAVLCDATNGGTLEKQGNGLLALFAENTYTGGTTIAAGTLAFSSTGSLASSPIDVKSGATFDVSLKKGYLLAAGKTLTGSGTIVGDLSVSGIHAPGNSTGVETVKGNYSLLGELQIELAGTTPGTGYDEVLISGSSAYKTTLSGTLSLDWTNFTGSTDATQLWIVKNDTAGTLSGAFSNYANGSSLGPHDGRSWYLYYNADAATGNLTGGNDVLISPVPEPATIVLLTLSALAAIAWRRKM